MQRVLTFPSLLTHLFTLLPAQLRALEERAAELESKHGIGTIEAKVVEKVGKIERDPEGLFKLPATAADGASSEIGSVTFRVEKSGNRPLDTLD